ncbi:hydroxyacid dehydrogenase [Tsukamurella tyrosinosolvens]|uniref:Phosphoglycerate dehydrogenase n=1 Tax=Tsukamurella tyrosinosolvens TaxID=57704 RepID=A0A1H4ZB36_TSUTY|nr:D-2-hydroxyacid dehydrogenase family protein [Tsukamurella tyrosinosolvens]AUN41702.1 hydroxyacid dehydrogenase [Tsukamurella tyrosinosolvens]KXO95760.1 hydroxyacid dehydrogenase [Tsukamurella tyrosinosolvens]MEC4611999.1 D-2-hydroxyacid dehydrogenase family protein [Tsukamurella tyrosinosolvens]RDB48546.1 D-2-hydroxyacid dehydrogenase family protein [Tsukamurella tyrosinosolvens]SED27446.1 Phosphoglycerate dehydrogenase [Tsukamurella tyrosinosolvens]
MRIAILDDFQDVSREYGDFSGLDVTVFTEPLTDVAAQLAEFDGVVAMRERTRFPADVLRSLPRLRLLVSTGRRNAAIDLDAASELGITVCHTGYRPAAAAEHTWALILAALRHVPTEDANVRAGRWQSTVGAELEGAVLGLVGLGNLGKRVARVAAAFGMDVIAWSSNLDAERAAEAGVTAVTKQELFARADVVTIHYVLSERSRGIVGAEDIARMKPGALLVNTSRSGVLDTPAAAAAARRGDIRLALDVFDVEPLPADDPIRDLPNSVLTGHVGYVTEQQYRLFYADAAEDVRAYLAGAPVRVMNP